MTLAAMTSIFTSAARQLKRSTVPLRPFIAASASVTSSSRLYASKFKKPTNAPAIEVSHSTAPSSGTAKALREPLGSATLAEGSKGKPDVRYKALRPGYTYDPYELKKARMVEPRPRRQRPPRLGPNRTEALKSDPIPYFNIRPDHEHLNPIFLNGFLTDMGKIKGRNETRLTRKSQRLVGKAIRRARAMGVLPTMHKALLYTFGAASGSRRNIP